MRTDELEKVLLDQIEKLNDDSVMDEPEKARILVERSRYMSDLANSFIELNRLKLDIVKEMSRNRGSEIYANYLGVEDNSAAAVFGGGKKIPVTEGPLPSKLDAIREKYRNGIPQEVVEDVADKMVMEMF